MTPTREDMARCCEDILVGAVVEDVNEVLAATAAELRRTCTWTADEDGWWAGTCGILWSFESGGPEENGHWFCGHCGGALIVVSYAEPTYED